MRHNVCIGWQHPKGLFWLFLHPFDCAMCRPPARKSLARPLAAALCHSAALVTLFYFSALSALICSSGCFVCFICQLFCKYQACSVWHSSIMSVILLCYYWDSWVTTGFAVCMYARVLLCCSAGLVMLIMHGRRWVSTHCAKPFHSCCIYLRSLSAD